MVVFTGQLLLEQNRAPEAVPVWLKAYSLDPTDHTTVFNTATALRLTGDYGMSETYYRLAVNTNSLVRKLYCYLKAYEIYKRTSR